MNAFSRIKQKISLFCLDYRIGEFRKMYCKYCKYYDVLNDRVYGNPKAVCKLPTECFGEKETFELSDGEGRCEMWTER